MLLSVLVLFCVICLVALFLLLPGESDMLQRAPFWGVNHAHRGLHTKDKSIPENSIAAFTGAVDAGYGIEMDLQLTKDGQVVVFHDDDLKRVCGAEGRLDSFTWEELQQYRIEGTQQKIPLLKEVLALVNGQVPLIIEFKTSPRNDALCESAWKILRQYDGDFCIESFDPRIVRWFKKNVPGILRGQLAATPKHLNSGIAGFLIGTCLGNFMGRPQFIAYQAGSRPFTVRIAEKFAMKVAWTSRSEADGDALEKENDAVIFEFYEPLAKYKYMPGEEDVFIAGEEALKQEQAAEKATEKTGDEEKAGEK